MCGCRREVLWVGIGLLCTRKIAYKYGRGGLGGAVGVCRNCKHKYSHRFGISKNNLCAKRLGIRQKLGK